MVLRVSSTWARANSTRTFPLPRRDSDGASPPPDGLFASITQTGLERVPTPANSNRTVLNDRAYPQVLKTLGRFIEGTPKVQTSDVVSSTFHKITVPLPV
jgi:hypothetical protein